MKIDDIKLNKSNPRNIKDEKFIKLVNSIRDFPKMMELRPIITDDDGLILGGNMRFRALMELGMKEVPKSWVKKASDLTEEEKKRFIIEDNVVFGEWDQDKLNEWDQNELVDWGLEERISIITSDQSNDNTGSFMNNISSNKTVMYIGRIYGIISKSTYEEIIKKYDFIENDEDHNGLIFEEILKSLL